MHELSSAEALASLVNKEAERAGAKRVTVVSLVLGKKSCLMPDILRDCFALFAEGTVSEGAELRFSPAGDREFYLESLEIDS